MGPDHQAGPAEPSLSLQEQIKQGEKFLQPLAGWEAADLGTPGARFLALRAQLTEFSRALAQRRQRLADAERLFQFFKQVGEGSCPWHCGYGAKAVAVTTPQQLQIFLLVLPLLFLIFSLTLKSNLRGH